MSPLGERMLGPAFAGALGREGSLGGQGHGEDAGGLWERTSSSLWVRQAQEDPPGRKSPRTSGESSTKG